MQHWVSRRRETSLEMRDLQLQANPCNACVITRNWSRGERFESARRLSFLPANPIKAESLRYSLRGHCQQWRLTRRLVNAVGGVLSHRGYPA
jgi:hypothetical protein